MRLVRARRSFRMSTSSRLQEPKDAAFPPSTEPYVDWGPPLPDQYTGDRARVIVANPTTVYVAWETSQRPPDGWRLEVVVDGGIVLQRVLVGAETREHWLAVAPRTRGAVHLARGAAGSGLVAVLPFETPPDAPSTNTNERWGRLDAHGHLHRDARVVPGRGIGPGYEAPFDVSTSAYSSSVGTHGKR